MENVIILLRASAQILVIRITVLEAGIRMH
jgi:hypothetical protein